LWGHRAVPVGISTADPELLKVLCEWADVICPLQAYFSEAIPKEYHGKITHHFDIGGDVWGVPYKGELQKLVDERIFSYLLNNKIPHLTSLVRDQEKSPLSPDKIYKKQYLVTGDKNGTS
jgi:hypothetical protein